ncbi:glycine cleavage system aminomethyltransferase GcvT [Candidatus Poribacteria bacterium]|nr:glycine cleavage system aminomethyltransferase GcvT [Candidatus Poribacteria bacterium]
MSDPTTLLKRTPLYHAHLRSGARMVSFGGWEMPVDYGSQLSEHEAVRNHAGMFDVSHMGQVRFRGKRVLPFLGQLVPGNVWRLGDYMSLYTTLCTPEGGVVDDLIITMLGEREAFSVVNAATARKDFAWMEKQRDALGYEDVSVLDESGDWAMIAVQGPEALGIMERLVPEIMWTETKAFTMHEVLREGALHMFSRTGYTGENGLEILCPPEMAETWWNSLLDAGVKPAGLGARDSLRLEMGYCLYGQDLSESITPIEAGLAWTVGFKKDEQFIGRAVLEKQRTEGPPRQAIGLKLDNRRPLRHGDKVLDGGRDVGEVTSGGFSPTLGVGIAMALVESASAKKEKLTVLSRGKECEAAVQKPPFVKVKSLPVK